MRRRTQAGLIKPLACAAGSESIEGWRAKIETLQSRTLNPPKGASRGEVNNGRLSQRVMILLMEKKTQVQFWSDEVQFLFYPSLDYVSLLFFTLLLLCPSLSLYLHP